MSPKYKYVQILAALIWNLLTLVSFKKYPYPTNSYESSLSSSNNPSNDWQFQEIKFCILE